MNEVQQTRARLIKRKRGLANESEVKQTKAGENTGDKSWLSKEKRPKSSEDRLKREVCEKRFRTQLGSVETSVSISTMGPFKGLPQFQRGVCLKVRINLNDGSV